MIWIAGGPYGGIIFWQGPESDEPIRERMKFETRGKDYDLRQADDIDEVYPCTGIRVSQKYNTLRELVEASKLTLPHLTALIGYSS